MPFRFNGKTFYLPGSYGYMAVLSTAGATIPDFNVGLIIARGMKGISYNCANKTGDQLIEGFSDSNAVLNEFGDDNILNAYKWASKHGAETVFILNSQPLTKAAFTLKDITPADAMKLTAKDSWSGPLANDIKVGLVETASTQMGNYAGQMTGSAADGSTSTTLQNLSGAWTISQLSGAGAWVTIISGMGIGQTRKITANTATVLTVSTWTTTPDHTSVYLITEGLFSLSSTPPKLSKRIVVDTGTIDTIYLNSVISLSVGMQVEVTDNSKSAPIDAIIRTINPIRDNTNKGYRVTFESALSSSCTLANEARIFQLNTDMVEVITWLGNYSNQQIIDAITTNSNIWDCVSMATTLPVTFSADYVQHLSSNTAKGTWGTDSTQVLASSLSDYTNIVTNFPKWAKEFTNINKIKIRDICVDSSDAAVHSVFRDLTITMRTKLAPIIAVVGTNWGDTQITSSDASLNPINRAITLNSDNIVLCAGGLNNQPSAMSLTPGLFGLKLANATNHNLTRDIIIADSYEISWDEEGLGQLTKLTKNGVLTYGKFDNGTAIVQGLNTYQSQDQIWNENDNKSFLQMPRDLGDRFFRMVIEGLDRDLVGGDKITKRRVAEYCVATGQSAKGAGIILDYQLISITYNSGAFMPILKIFVDEPTDYFGTGILIGTPIPEDLKNAQL